MPEHDRKPVSLHWCFQCDKLVTWAPLIHQIEVHAPKIGRFSSGHTTDWRHGKLVEA